MKGLVTDFTDMGQSVFDGINKLIHDIAGGVGKDDLDDGMFEHAEASMQQPHSSSKQPTQAAQDREKKLRRRRVKYGEDESKETTMMRSMEKEQRRRMLRKVQKD